MTSEDAACLVTTLDQWAGDGRTVTELTADQASDMLDKTTPPSSPLVDSSLYDFEEDMLPDDHHGDVSRDVEGHNAGKWVHVVQLVLNRLHYYLFTKQLLLGYYLKHYASVGINSLMK